VCSDSGGTASSCNITAVEPSDEGTSQNVTMAASATAAFGSLSVHSAFGPEAGGSFNLAARATFLDTLTIGGYSGSGFIQYHLTGLGSSFDYPGVFEGFAINGGVPLDSPPSDGLRLFNDFGFSPPGYTSHLYAFTSGTPFSFQLNAVTSIRGQTGDEGFNGFTVAVDQISVFDASGQPLAGYSLTSASGAPYPAVGQVLEPSSLWLVMTVLFGCAGVIRRKIASI
jgi:hypothetical protein